jgi:hypothetical protein
MLTKIYPVAVHGFDADEVEMDGTGSDQIY